MRAAAHLDIPFVTLDLEREYKEGVIDYMIREYEAGRTPNPDVMCNREVKFGAFWKWAQAQGADYIATGHYAQNVSGSRGADGHFHMLVSKDLNKDQTYFLWTLTQDDLGHVLFPVGDMTKDEVRSWARKFKLPNAEKKDSQGLCFIGKVDVKEFLKHYIKTQPGKVLNEAGKEIGEHPGALLFTIGERHGFTVTAKTPRDAPYYVVSKDAAANTITVSNRAVSPTQPVQLCTIKNISWTAAPLQDGDHLQARTRYREPLLDIEIVSISGTGSSSSAQAQIRFAKPHQTITPGQSLVFYRKADIVEGIECLGGGIIV